jgi:hypothetical protein
MLYVILHDVTFTVYKNEVFTAYRHALIIQIIMFSIHFVVRFIELYDDLPRVCVLKT